MFKKRNRQNSNRRVRNREESSDEESSTPIIKSTNHLNEKTETTKDIDVTSSQSTIASKVSTSGLRANRKAKLQNSFFSSNKPKFTKNVDLSKSYDNNQATDGLDSIKPKDIELNLKDIKELNKELSSDDAMETEENNDTTQNDDYIPIHNTKSLRSFLRKRNQMDLSEDEESIPKETQDESNDLSASSSDEEARWERHLVERGISGPTVHHTVVEAITHGNPSDQYSLVSQDHVIKRLSNVLNDLQINYDENVRIIAQTEKEIEEIEEEDRNEYANRMKTENRYDFYQKETVYFRKLSGYLTDKKQELEEDYNEYLELLKQYKWSNDYINQLYLMDDVSYLQQLRCIHTIVNQLPSYEENETIRKKAGPFYKGEIYYEKDFTQTRMADRTLYVEDASCIKESIHEVSIQNQVFNPITIPIDFYLTNCIFYNYNDQSTEQSIQLLQAVREKISHLFEKKALMLMSIQEVLNHFSHWREEYPDDYENAYVSLSIDDFIPVVLFPSLMLYDPLDLQEEGGISSIHDLPWFPVLKDFCEKTTQQRDTLLLPRYIQKHVIPFLNNIVLYEWNPLSIREAGLLQTALFEVASYFNTVISELRTLYGSVTQRIQQAIQSTVYFIPSLLSEQSNDIQTDAQEITEMYVARGIRLLEVVNTLAPFMEKGTPAPCIDNLVTMVCCYLKGMAQQPCLLDRCKEFAVKIESLIPNEVLVAKQEIQRYI